MYPAALALLGGISLKRLSCCFCRHKLGDGHRHRYSPDISPRHGHERNREVPGSLTALHGAQSPVGHSPVTPPVCLLPQQHFFICEWTKPGSIRISPECPWATSQAFPLSLSASVPKLFILHQRIARIFITRVGALSFLSSTNYFPLTAQKRGGRGREGRERRGEFVVSSFSLLSIDQQQFLLDNNTQIACAAQLLLCLWESAGTKLEISELMSCKSKGGEERGRRELNLQIQLLPELRRELGAHLSCACSIPAPEPQTGDLFRALLGV